MTSLGLMLATVGRRSAAVLALLALGAFAAAASAELAPNATSNVLLIVADDVGIDKVRCYGFPTAPPTPTLDSLAQQGVRFENAWANPACSATRAAMLTGRYGFRTGVGYVQGPDCPALNLSETTLPELLASSATFAGSTALIGKWHNGTAGVGELLAPNLAGFGHFSGILGNLETESYFDWSKVENGVASSATNYITTDQVDEALAWIDQQSTGWFCQLSLSAAHAPFVAPPAHLHTQQLPAQTPHGDALPFYDATVEAMDKELGRLLASIAPATLQRTLVIFCGDNGTPPEGVQPPLDPNKAKLTLYEPGIRVPLIIVGGPVAEPDRVVLHVAHVIDLYATIANVLAPGVATKPTGVDSVSLLPYLSSPTADAQRAYVYSEGFKSNDTVAWGWKQALRNARYKLIRTVDTATDQFFDLSSDPLEQTDLLAGGALSAAELRQYRKLAASLGKLVANP
jgi:arylsulfatase A-like enzyme